MRENKSLFAVLTYHIMPMFSRFLQSRLLPSFLSVSSGALFVQLLTALPRLAPLFPRTPFSLLVALVLWAAKSFVVRWTKAMKYVALSALV